MPPAVAAVKDDVFNLTFAEKTVLINGQSWKFRELSVKESDQCAEAARKPNDEFDGRVMMRMMVVASTVEPKITLDQLADIPNRMYLKLCEVVNELNAADYDEGTPVGED